MLINYGLILFNIFYFSTSQIIYEFSSDLDLKENMTDNEIFTALSYNDLYTYLKIGTPPKELKVSISFQEKSLIILGSKIKSRETFNETDSRSYKKISEEINLIKNQLFNGYISEEVIHLNNYNKNLKIQFILGEEIYKNSYDFSDEYEPINFSGYIGLAINGLFRQDLPDSLPIYLYNNYKDQYNFKSAFSMIFDSSNDKNHPNKGKLIFNSYPNEYYNISYYKEQYKSSRLQKNNDNFEDWCIALDSTYYGNTIVEENTKIIFRPEFGIIIIGNEFWKYLINNYFKEYINQKLCNVSTYDLIGDDYNYIYCSNKININEFQKINFELKDMDFNFTLDSKDLFYQFNNKYYFLVATRLYRNLYIFGSILMKKYDLYFDKYNSNFGVYNRNVIINDDDTSDGISSDSEDGTDGDENKKNKTVLIILIVVLSLLITIVLIYMVWSHINKPRIQRKNELSDDYNYVPETAKIN